LDNDDAEPLLRKFGGATKIVQKLPGITELDALAKGT